MRIVNTGRLGLPTSGGVIDVETASDARFSCDVQAVYEQWTEFREWARTADNSSVRPLDRAALGSPAPRPRQVFAIGLNYRDHAEESDMDISDASMVVFTNSRPRSPARSLTSPCPRDRPTGRANWW